jgi:hypothetical protein
MISKEILVCLETKLGFLYPGYLDEKGRRKCFPDDLPEGNSFKNPSLLKAKEAIANDQLVV